MIFFPKFFWFLLFEVAITSFSKDKKYGNKEVIKQQETRFFLLFLLYDRRIRIRIRNTGYLISRYVGCLPLLLFKIVTHRVSGATRRADTHTGKIRKKTPGSRDDF
jgi:hypothetical protein